MLGVLTRNRDFRNLFLADLVVLGGDWFALIPLVTLLHQLTGSGLPGALALAADTMVNALVLPFAGAFADRFDRRRILISANIGTFAAIALLYLVEIPGLYWIGPAAIGLAAAGKAYYAPAVGAALPNVVEAEDLPAANALAGSAWGTMLVVGASLGGLLDTLLGPYVCFGITLACLAGAALIVVRIRRPLQAPREPSASAATLRSVAQALGYIRRQPRVLSLVTVKTAVGLGNGVLAAFPVLATVVFSAGSLGTGLLFAARGLGALLGPLALRRVLLHRSWLMPGLAVSMAAYGVAYLGVALTPWFAVALGCVVLAHMAGGGNWTMSNYALQTEVPDELRGRVLATDMMIVMLGVSVSTLLVGALVDHASARVLAAACGSVTLVYGVGWRLSTRRLMRATADLTPAASVVISPR
jgi:MFS family permease